MSAVLQRPDGRPSVGNAETPPPQVGLDLGITASLQGHSKTDLWHIGGGGGGGGGGERQEKGGGAREKRLVLGSISITIFTDQSMRRRGEI